MTSRELKIALAASVALNVFAVASGATLWVAREQIAKRVSEARQTPRREPWSILVARIGPEAQDEVRARLRTRAMEARPDFEQAREARRRAIRMTQDDTFNPVEVAALLESSRASELRGRAHLETGAVEVLASLPADDRKILAPILSRHNPRNDKTGAGEKGAGQGDAAGATKTTSPAEASL